MKMGEFDTFMNDLAEVSGVPRTMLDKTPALVLFRLKVALDERNKAREERDAAKEALEAYQRTFAPYPQPESYGDPGVVTSLTVDGKEIPIQRVKS